MKPGAFIVTVLYSAVFEILHVLLDLRIKACLIGTYRHVEELSLVPEFLAVLNYIPAVHPPVPSVVEGTGEHRSICKHTGMIAGCARCVI